MRAAVIVLQAAMSSTSLSPMLNRCRPGRSSADRRARRRPSIIAGNGIRRWLQAGPELQAEADAEAAAEQAAVEQEAWA